MPEAVLTTDKGVRVGLAVTIVLALGVFGSLIWLVHGWYDPTNDGAMYILTGRSIARGEGYAMLGIPFLIRPPGFSLLIAPLLARGTDFFTLHLFVSLFGAAGVVLLQVYLRPLLGTWLATLAAVAVWLNPGYQLLCNQTMSDVPGSTLFIACLLLERWVARRPANTHQLLLGAAIGLSAYVRTVNLLLIPAILAARLARRCCGPERSRPWRATLLGLGALVLGAVLVQAPWAVRNRVVAQDPPADQTLLYSYSSGMWNEDMGDPHSARLPLASVLGRFPLRCEQLSITLGSRMKDVERKGSYHVVTIALLLGVLATLVKRRSSTEFFVFGTLLIIAFYFGFAPRLLLPILVLAVPAAVEAVRDLGDALGRRAAGRPLGTILATVALGALIAVDFEPRRDWDKIQQKHNLLTELTTRYATHLEPEDRLGTNRGWHYGVFLDRPVYSLEFAIKRAGGDVSAGEAIIDRYDLNKVLLSPTRIKDQEVLPYFAARYPNQSGFMARVYRVR